MKDTISVLHPGIEAPRTSVAAATSSQSSQRGLAPRLSAGQGVRGRRIAVLDNTKVNAAEFLNAIATRLLAQGALEVRSWRKRHAGESGAAVIPDLLKWGPDLALTGLGD
jgi:hypothetical protein